MTQNAFGPPCASRTVDASLRMSIAGLSWGVFMGSYDAKLQGLAGRSKAAFVAKAIAKHSFGWGFVGGCYVGLYCAFETLRRKQDSKNAMLAGFFTGAMASTFKSNRVTFLTACAAACVTTVIDMASGPVEQPPAGIDMGTNSSG